ncbi:MAG TPA: kelch repeat-containing protein [Planctomycetota bacterium]|nr:kelch repeat-containing protein [Planctomycetota bacterium]
MPRPTAAVVALTIIASLAGVSDLRAQWQQRSPGLPGQSGSGVAAAFHAAGGFTVGMTSAGVFTYDGRRVANVAAPLPPRDGASMAHDSARGRTVLFGGFAASGGVLGDTWEYDGSTWINRTPAVSPSPRGGALLVYDSWRQCSMLVGGFVGGLGTSDTWKWDGTSWTSGPSLGASVRGAAAGAFDELRGHVLVFGGSTTLGGPARNDFWQFDGSAWVRLLSPPIPPARSGAAMAYEPRTGHTLLFGGDSGGTPLGDTWDCNGAVWSNVTPPVAPAARTGQAMVYDQIRQRITLLDGQSAAGGLDEVWTWSTDPRPYAVAYGDVCGSRTLLPANGSLPAIGQTFAMNVGAPANLLFAAIGFSNLATASGPLPQPLPGSATCQLWIDPAAAILLGASATWSLPIPLQPTLLAVEFYAQTFELQPGGTPLVTSSNGLEGRLGLVVADQTTSALLDAATTDADTTAIAAAVTVGGDGRHGDFDPRVGVDLGNQVFEWDTDHTTLPARLTLSGRDELVGDGQFLFSNLLVPAGTTVRFRGAHPAVLRVRGNVRIDGTIDLDGDPMTTFVSHSTTAVLPGQPGGRPGAGGGAGGRGADRCLGTGPTFVNGINVNNGVAGQDVPMPAGHPLAALAAGTGGAGCLLFPGSGLDSAISFTILSNIFSGNLAGGGGGGGYRGPGSNGVVVPQLNTVPGPVTAGGIALPLPIVPAGTSSLSHYLIGGGGGGGGGSHPFLAIAYATIDIWRAGAGGSGGGGALALRCGRDLGLGNGGRVEARGGAGVIFSIYSDGFAAPGGGGSGGSLLLQATGTLQNQGAVDVSGGGGSQIANLPTWTSNPTSNGGAGAPGLLRLEAGQQVIAGNTTPAVTAADLGTLLDTDARTGLRSIWLPVSPPNDTSVLVRYELTVTWNGSVTTFSDDPAVGPPLMNPSGQIVARFQGTHADPNNNPDPLQAGPWRTEFGAASRRDNCNRDLPQFVRCDLAFPIGNRPVVQGLRLLWH